MKYQVVFKASVKKDVRYFPQAVIDRIKHLTQELSQNPKPTQSKKLRGYPHHYRLRFSQYRLLYHLDESKKIITIIKIGHRKDVYR